MVPLGEHWEPKAFQHALLSQGKWQNITHRQIKEILRGFGLFSGRF
jgi:hypothetical protein